MAFFGADMNVSTDQIAWFVFYCHQENRPYYYDPMSGTTTWSLPKDGILSSLPGAPMDSPPPPTVIIQSQTQQPVTPTSTTNDDDEEELTEKKNEVAVVHEASKNIRERSNFVWKIICGVLLLGNLLSWGLLFGEPACIDGLRDTASLLASDAQSKITQEIQFISTGLTNISLYSENIYDNSRGAMRHNAQALTKVANDSFQVIRTAASDQWTAVQNKISELMELTIQSYRNMEEAVRFKVEQVATRNEAVNTEDNVESADHPNAIENQRVTLPESDPNRMLEESVRPTVDEIAGALRDEIGIVVDKQVEMKDDLVTAKPANSDGEADEETHSDTHEVDTTAELDATVVGVDEHQPGSEAASGMEDLGLQVGVLTDTDRAEFEQAEAESSLSVEETPVEVEAEPLPEEEAHIEEVSEDIPVNAIPAEQAQKDGVADDKRIGDEAISGAVVIDIETTVVESPQTKEIVDNEGSPTEEESKTAAEMKAGSDKRIQSPHDMDEANADLAPNESSFPVQETSVAESIEESSTDTDMAKANAIIETTSEEEMEETSVDQVTSEEDEKTPIYVSVDPQELKSDDKSVSESSLERILQMATDAGVTIDPSLVQAPRPPLRAAMCPGTPELRALLSHCQSA